MNFRLMASNLTGISKLKQTKQDSSQFYDSKCGGQKFNK